MFSSPKPILHLEASTQLDIVLRCLSFVSNLGLVAKRCSSGLFTFFQTICKAVDNIRITPSTSGISCPVDDTSYTP